MLNHFSFPVFMPGPPNHQLLRDLSSRVTRYQQTITARGWYETATLEVPCAVDEARWWCDQLYASTMIYDDTPMPIWEGYLSQVEARIGGTAWTVSLDGAASRVRCRYTTVLGTPGTSDLQVAASATYGTKDLVLSSDSAKSKAAANAVAAAELARRVTPLASRSIQPGQQQQDGVTLTFRGWYTTLDWLVTSRTDTTEEYTSDQIATLLGTTAQGFAGTRSGIVLDTTQIAASGLTSTRQIAQDTTFRAAIEARLSMGLSDGSRYVWGVGPSQTFFARASAERATWDPFSSERRWMLRQQGDQVVDLRGAPVPPWRAVPDVVVLGAADTSLGGAADRSGRTYIDRVTCEVTADGARVSLEPLANDSAVTRLGALG